MQRRTFLKTAAVSTVAGAFTRPLFGLPASHPYMSKMGLQLWTVRNQMAESIPATLKAVAAAGYKQVELGATLNQGETINAAKDNGMGVTSAFIDWQSVANPTARGAASVDAIIEEAVKQQLKFLVFGYIGKGRRETSDLFRQHAENANKAGEKARSAGIQMCYHNHSFEFARLPDGNYGWDIFVDRFDHDLVKFEVDVFWVKIGGRDPVAAIRNLSGRVGQIHLKDLKAGAATETDEGRVPNDAFQELGNGTIDMAEVIRVSQAAGADQCHVEQDQSPDPIASIGTSMRHLNSI